MEADTAFVAHIRAANDLLGARQLTACEALLDWANSTTGSASKTSERSEKYRAGSSRTKSAGASCRDQDATLKQKMLTKWGL